MSWFKRKQKAPSEDLLKALQEARRYVGTASPGQERDDAIRILDSAIIWLTNNTTQKNLPFDTREELLLDCQAFASNEAVQQLLSLVAALPVQKLNYEKMEWEAPSAADLAGASQRRENRLSTRENLRRARGQQPSRD